MPFHSAGILDPQGPVSAAERMILIDATAIMLVVVWSVPAMVVILLAGVGWTGSHQLDPALKLTARAQSIRVEVVSLDWKWLFIYPDQGVASVNQLVGQHQQCRRPGVRPSGRNAHRLRHAVDHGAP